MLSRRIRKGLKVLATMERMYMSGKNGEGKGKFVNQAIKLSLAANVLFHLIAKNDIAAGSKLVAAKLHCLATNVRGRPINKFLNGIILLVFSV